MYAQCVLYRAPSNRISLPLVSVTIHLSSERNIEERKEREGEGIKTGVVYNFISISLSLHRFLYINLVIGCYALALWKLYTPIEIPVLINTSLCNG